MKKVTIEIHETIIGTVLMILTFLNFGAFITIPILTYILKLNWLTLFLVILLDIATNISISHFLNYIYNSKYLMEELNKFYNIRRSLNEKFLKVLKDYGYNVREVAYQQIVQEGPCYDNYNPPNLLGYEREYYETKTRNRLYKHDEAFSYQTLFQDLNKVVIIPEELLEELIDEYLQTNIIEKEYY